MLLETSLYEPWEIISKYFFIILITGNTTGGAFRYVPLLILHRPSAGMFYRLPLILNQELHD